MWCLPAPQQLLYSSIIHLYLASLTLISLRLRLNLHYILHLPVVLRILNQGREVQTKYYHSVQTISFDRIHLLYLLLLIFGGLFLPYIIFLTVINPNRDSLRPILLFLSSKIVVSLISNCIKIIISYFFTFLFLILYLLVRSIGFEVGERNQYLLLCCFFHKIKNHHNFQIYAVKI